MKQSSGKYKDFTEGLLPELTRSIFLADSYHDSLSGILLLLFKELDAAYAECRSKDVNDPKWILTCAFPDKLAADVENIEAVNDSIDFFKPSLGVVDEVWLTNLSSTSDPLIPKDVQSNEQLWALCIQTAFSNGRNELFRFLFDQKQKHLTKRCTSLNKLLPEIKKLLQKKYSEELTSQSEQQYRRLFDEDLTPNFIISQDGSIVRCNRAFTDLFGFKNQRAALQSNFNDRFTNYMHQVFFWEALLRGEEIKNHEMPASKVDGENVYIILKVVTEYDEKQNLKEIVGYIQDITNRKEVEVALRKSEERYRSLIETTNDWIWEIDEDYCLTYSSLKIHTILGYDLKSVLGKSIFDLMPENNRKKSEDQFKKFAHQQKAFINEEHSFVDSSGSIAIFETSGIPLFTNNGIFQGYRGIAKEITERKQTEKQIAMLNDELEYKVVERTKMLQIANKELEAFSYSVSHDLRAPLRSIDGFSQALIEDYASILDKTGNNYLSRVRSAAQRMSTLIDDMIKLAKVSRTSLAKKELDLSDIATSIADSLSEAAPERDAAFVIQPNMMVTGDKNLMKVALQNLMENAWKFTSKQPETRIEVGTEQISGETVYFVRDNGAGFDMSYAKKLFAPFQRLHKESDFPGTGIGLSTVQRIIHRHLGKIWAEGDINNGAVFYFTLKPNDADVESSRTDSEFSIKVDNKVNN